MKIDVFAPTGPVWPKFSGIEGVARTNHSSYQKTRMNNLSCGIRIFAVLSQSARLTDGQEGLAIPCVALDVVAR